MKRPTSFQFVLGNPITGLVVFGLACFVWYKWSKGDAATLAAGLMLIAVLTVGKAFDVVNNYRHKQREWEILSGQPVTGGVNPKRMRQVRIAFAMWAWIGMAFLAWRSRDQPDMKIAAWAFAAGSVIGLIGLIWKNWPKRRSRKSQWKDIAVSLCLKTPSRSPSVAQTVRELPGIYAALLAPPRRQ